jgi:hypothetical protein
LPAPRVTLGVANSSQRVAQHPMLPGVPWVAKGVAAAAMLDISTTWKDSPVLQLLLGGDGFGSAAQYLPSPLLPVPHTCVAIEQLSGRDCLCYITHWPLLPPSPHLPHFLGDTDLFIAGLYLQAAGVFKSESP